MARRPTVILKDPHKAFLVQRLAVFDSPKEAAEALKEYCGLEISPQRAEGYDPNKRAGRGLAKRWRELFQATRSEFLKHIEVHVPQANKAVRVKKLARAADAMEHRGNYVGMADMLERIAKEMGNVHTNRREITGKDGKPIQVQDMTEEQVDRELALLCEEAGIATVEAASDAIH